MAKKASFEEALGRLNEIVKKLETGDVALEESMRLYEEGMRLGRLCKGILKEAHEIHKAGGDDALLAWYESLPPERQDEFMHEYAIILTRIQNFFDAVRPALGDFAEAISDWTRARKTAFTEAMNARPVSGA